MFFRRSDCLFAVLILVVASFTSAGQTSSSAAPAKKQSPTAAQVSAPAESKSTLTADWQTLQPENEDFTILMPKDTATEIEKYDYHKMVLNTRLYLSAPANGPVVAVASFSGIKSNPAAYSELARFNSYADAFKNFLPPKIRKDAPTKMVLVSTKPFHGYTGRVYKLTIGDLAGTVNAYATRKRFYAIAILNAKKDEALEEKFLSSFVIPDKPIEQPVATAETVEQQTASQANNQAQRPQRGVRKPVVPTGTPGNNPATSSVQVNEEEDNSEPGTANAQPSSQQGTQNQQTQPKRAPISGGMLNSKAIYLPPPDAIPGQPAGVVLVQILVDEQGAVIEAKAVSGPAALHQSAVNAARLARFMPTILAGEAVKVTGTLSYNFTRTN